MNDIDGRLPVLFKDCAYGKYTTKNHPEWISRDEFNRMKAEDAYLALVWSFGNNGKDYLYGADIEEFKHAYHILVFEGDPEPLKKYGLDIRLSNKENAYDRYLQYSAQIKAAFDTNQHKYELENYERLQTLERMQSLESLQSLQSLQSDYRQVQIPEGALIYCDIPYRDTNCGKYDGFNHDEFYQWAEKQDNIFISEYDMPDSFIEIARIDKPILSTANGASGTATEKIYTNERTYKRYNGVICDVQLSFF